MAETKLTRAEVAKQISAALKEKLVKFESDVQELKAREGSTREKKLEKHELCPLCGGPDVNAVCDCLKKSEPIAKNALMGYGPGTPGSGQPSDTGMGSMGGGGTQPMAMAEGNKAAAAFAKQKRQAQQAAKDAEKKKGDSKKKDAKAAADAKKDVSEQIVEKAMNGEGGGGITGTAGLGKAEMCKDCGYEHMEGKHALKKDGAGLSDVGALSKKTPEGISEKTMHKLKDEYGHDKEGKAKAYATANAIASGTVNHKAEGGMAKHTPGMAAPSTSVAQANKEMGGFQSLASNPIHSASMGGGALKTPAPLSAKAPRPHIPSMGRAAGTGFSVKMGGVEGGRGGSVSGTIANAKAEMSSNYGDKTGIKITPQPRPGTHGVNAPSSVKKDEKEMARTPAVPEKAAKGTKMPEVGESVDAKKTGAGGQIKEGKSLRKDAMSPSYAKKVGMDVKGVGGKQPVGQGGGDATPKMPALRPMNAKLPPPKGSKSNLSQKDSPLKAAGRAEVKRMVGDATPYSNPNAKQLPAEDVDVSEFDKGPNRLAPFKGADGQVDPHGGQKMFRQSMTPGQRKTGSIGAAGLNGDDALQGVRDDLNVAADKRAGGVGFLSRLINMFHRPQAAGPGGRGTTIPTDSTGGVRTMPAGTPTGTLKRAPMTRFRGALPLQRSEQPLASLGTCAFCNGPEHGGTCK